MKVTVSSKEFEVFLNAIMRVEKDGSILTIHKDYIEALTLTKNIVSLLVYSKINILNPEDINDEELMDEDYDKISRKFKTVEGQKSIGIKDLKKFQRLLELNGSSETFTFEVKGNYIYYQNDKVKGAKFALAQKDRLVKSNNVTVEWFNSFKKNMRMKLPQEDLKRINAAAQFVSENVRKVYFYQEDENVVAEVNDKQKVNVDAISFNLGSPEEGRMTTPIIVDSNALSLIYDRCEEFVLESSPIKDRHGQTAEILFLTVVQGNVLIKYLINGQKD